MDPRWAQETIFVPRRPFWTILGRFGRDEAIVNILATAVISLFSSNALVLALFGPVAEKIAGNLPHDSAESARCLLSRVRFSIATPVG